MRIIFKGYTLKGSSLLLPRDRLHPFTHSAQRYFSSPSSVLCSYSREDKDLGIALQTPPGSQASHREEAKDCALLSSRDADLLEPTDWPKGSQASSSVWREDSGLLSRPGRKRRRSPREDGGISGVSSSCGARGGFLTRHDEDLRSLSCGTREARSPWARRGGACLCSLVQGGDKGLKTL